MEYQRASLIRGTSLSGLIGERYSAGQGFGGAIRGAISDTLKAKAVGLKERVDPLNIVRQLTGRGAFGNIMTAVAGRALGRSQRDIAYFGGYTRRRSTIPSLESPETGGTGARGSGDNSEMLEKIYQFLKRSTDERKRTEQLNRSFRREQVNEDERRHQDLVDAIKGFAGEPTAKPIKEKEGGLLDMISGMITGAIDKLMESFAWLKDLKTTIVSFFKLFAGNTLTVLGRLIPLLGNPMFLAVAAGAATIYGLTKLLSSLSEITPDFKQLSPFEARNALMSEGEIVKQAQARYNKKDVTPEQIKETKEYLENRVLKGKEEAERISKIEDEDERKKAIREFGGEALLKKTLEDKNVYTLPSTSEVQKLPEVVRPRPTKKGTEPQMLLWDKEFGQTHDPITGMRLDIQKENESELSRLKNRATATAATTTGGGRGTMAGPTAADFEGAPTPTPSPTPVPRVVPDITPMPEMPQESATSQPIVQTNTHTNVIGGSKDRVLATSTPKQRNTDLNRYLTNNSVAV